MVSVQAEDTHTQEQFQRTGSVYWGMGWVFIPLARWPGPLGQGLCGCVQLARTGTLEDVSPACSGTVGRWWEPSKVKQGMKHDNCQVILTRVAGGAAGFSSVPGWAILI